MKRQILILCLAQLVLSAMEFHDDMVTLRTSDKWQFIIPLERAKKLSPIKNGLIVNPDVRIFDFRFITGKTFLPIYNHLMKFKSFIAIDRLPDDQRNQLCDAARFLEYWPILALLNRHILQKEIKQGVDEVTILSGNPDYKVHVCKKVNHLLERIPHKRKKFGQIALQDLLSAGDPSSFHTVYIRKGTANNSMLAQLVPFLADFNNIQKLDITCSIGPKLSKVIYSLSALKSLTLTNYATSQLSDSISELTNLKYLTLNNNGLTGLPAALGYVTKLRTLHVKMNGLRSLPDQMGKLKKLRWLDVTSNNLSSLPVSMSSLEQLEKLYGAFNDLTEIPTSLCTLPHLTTLNLSSNTIMRIDAISMLSNLKTLELSHNQITKVPTSIAHLSHLMHLGLADNQLQCLPRSLFQLKRLYELDVSGNMITSLPYELQSMSHLSILKINDNPIHTHKRSRRY